MKAGEDQKNKKVIYETENEDYSQTHCYNSESRATECRQICRSQCVQLAAVLWGLSEEHNSGQ